MRITVPVLEKFTYYWEQKDNKHGNKQMNNFRYWKIPRREILWNVPSICFSWSHLNLDASWHVLLISTSIFNIAPFIWFLVCLCLWWIIRDLVRADLLSRYYYHIPVSSYCMAYVRYLINICGINECYFFSMN